MKRRYWIVAVLCFLFLLPGQAWALDRDVEEELGIPELSRAGESYLPDVKLEAVPDWNGGLHTILELGSGAIDDIVRTAVRSAVFLLVIVLLCSLGEGVFGSVGGRKSGVDVVSVVGALAITAVAVSDVRALLGMGRQAVGNMDEFSKLLMPSITAATAMSGAPAGAAARQIATMFCADLLITLQSRLLIPLVYAYVAACTAYAAIGNEGLKRIAGGIKWVVTSVLAIVLLSFVGYLSVSGVIAGTADAATIKAAKFTISGMVPVVGGILADAAETVLAGAGILKGSIGVFGMLVVLAICLVPFLQLGIHYLTYKCAAALSATVSAGRIGGLIDGIGGAFGLILGMTGACALVLLVSMVSAVSAVT